MIYRVVIFILLNIGLLVIIRPAKGHTFLLKKQSLARNKRTATIAKRQRLTGRKPNVLERFKTVSEEMLKHSRSGMTFSKYIRVSLLCSLAGIMIGLLLNNILLSAVLAAGMLFIPLEYLMIRQSSYTQIMNEQMETALSLITNSYLQSGDITKAVRENLHRIEQPFYNLFAEFIAEKTFIDSNISRNIRKLKNKVDNSFFAEWCDTLILCQQDRELMYVLPTIVEKMSDIKQMQEELNTQMYNIYKDHISVTLVVAANIPLMRFLNAEWYRLLTGTLAGQVIVALTFVVIFLAAAYVIKVNKPVSVL